MADRHSEKPVKKRDHPTGGKPNEPGGPYEQTETDKAARRHDKAEVLRDVDKRPHPHGPQYEEGGQYPGVRHDK